MEIITYRYHFESFRMKKKLSKSIKCNGGSGLDPGTEKNHTHQSKNWSKPNKVLV